MALELCKQKLLYIGQAKTRWTLAEPGTRGAPSEKLNLSEASASSWGSASSKKSTLFSPAGSSNFNIQVCFDQVRPEDLYYVDPSFLF